MYIVVIVWPKIEKQRNGGNQKLLQSGKRKINVSGADVR